MIERRYLQNKRFNDLSMPPLVFAVFERKGVNDKLQHIRQKVISLVTYFIFGKHKDHDDLETKYRKVLLGVRIHFSLTASVMNKYSLQSIASRLSSFNAYSPCKLPWVNYGDRRPRLALEPLPHRLPPHHLRCCRCCCFSSSSSLCEPFCDTRTFPVREHTAWRLESSNGAARMWTCHVPVDPQPPHEPGYDYKDNGK